MTLREIVLELGDPVESYYQYMELAERNQVYFDRDSVRYWYRFDEEQQTYVQYCSYEVGRCME